jgi:hypothetical protein
MKELNLLCLYLIMALKIGPNSLKICKITEKDLETALKIRENW